MTTAVKLGVHALAHTLIARKAKLSDAFIELMKQTKTYQMSTLTTMDAELAYYDTDRLCDPLLKLVAPESELKAAENRDIRRLAFMMILNYVQSKPPVVDGGLIKFIKTNPRLSMALFLWQMKLFNGERIQKKTLENSKDAIFRLYKAGVPIVMGSDTTYNPSSLYAFHGITSLREIELLGEAGLPPVEAIKAATLTPSKMLGIADETGTVEVGKRADLAIIKENPLKELRALRGIQWTVKNGVARTPAEWMNT